MSIDWEAVARAHTPPLRIAVLEAYDEVDGEYITPTEIAKGAGSSSVKVNEAVTVLRRKGLLGPRQLPSVEERFWRLVEIKDGEDSCWIWNGGKKPNGYGMFADGETIRNVHRYSYELLIGPIGDGLVLDHICRVRHCVNPEHLDPVLQKENVSRGALCDEAARSKALARTHCVRGHELTEENTYWAKSPTNFPRRVCRTCRRHGLARYRAKRNAELGPDREPATSVEAA